MSGNDSFMFASLAEELAQGLVSGCGSKDKVILLREPAGLSCPLSFFVSSRHETVNGTVMAAEIPNNLLRSAVNAYTA
jgi:hypothetical protein